MLCKKCGRELPYAGGKFCPFCGAPVEQTGVSDETQADAYTHLRAHETDYYLVCRLLLEKKKH